MKRLVKTIAFLALTAAAAIGLASCGGGDDKSSGGGGGGKEGGILNVTYGSFPDFMDPALSYTVEGWTAMAEVYLPLLTYEHANGNEGSEVIPGLAKDLPEISNGGKTYTLFLRPGLKYSDGTPVKASDFPFSVERMIELNSPGSSFYMTIEGAEKFAETKQGSIPGIEADDKTGEIVINLETPRGTFTNELALLFVAVLPQSTPIEDVSAKPAPATGPYMITKSQPGKGWEYARNPYWEKANGKAMPELPGGVIDGAKVTVIRNEQTQVDGVERGTYEWMQNPPPSSRYAEVKEKYDGSQFRVEPTISTYFFWMNTKQPPFDDVEVRQAVNHAVDPRALERIYAGQLTGSQQVLPEGMPGHEDLELYPYDVDKAKQMIEEADPSDMDITVWSDSESPNNEAGEYFTEVLRELGFDAKLKLLTADNYTAVIGNESTPNLDAGWSNWYQDYPHPNDFFQPLLAGESIQPTNNYNFSQFDQPAINKKIIELGEEQLGPEEEAGYQELDKEVMELAPWAPFGSRTVSTFVSDEIDLDSVIFNLTMGQYLSSFEFK